MSLPTPKPNELATQKPNYYHLPFSPFVNAQNVSDAAHSLLQSVRSVLDPSPICATNLPNLPLPPLFTPPRPQGLIAHGVELPNSKPLSFLVSVVEQHSLTLPLQPLEYSMIDEQSLSSTSLTSFDPNPLLKTSQKDFDLKGNDLALAHLSCINLFERTLASSNTPKNGNVELSQDSVLPTLNLMFPLLTDLKPSNNNFLSSEHTTCSPVLLPQPCRSKRLGSNIFATSKFPPMLNESPILTDSNTSTAESAMTAICSQLSHQLEQSSILPKQKKRHRAASVDNLFSVTPRLIPALLDVTNSSTSASSLFLPNLLMRYHQDTNDLKDIHTNINKHSSSSTSPNKTNATLLCKKNAIRQTARNNQNESILSPKKYKTSNTELGKPAVEWRPQNSLVQAQRRVRRLTVTANESQLTQNSGTSASAKKTQKKKASTGDVSTRKVTSRGRNATTSLQAPEDKGFITGSPSPASLVSSSVDDHLGVTAQQLRTPRPENPYRKNYYYYNYSRQAGGASSTTVSRRKRSTSTTMLEPSSSPAVNTSITEQASIPFDLGKYEAAYRNFCKTYLDLETNHDDIYCEEKRYNVYEKTESVVDQFREWITFTRGGGGGGTHKHRHGHHSVEPRVTRARSKRSRVPQDTITQQESSSTKQNGIQKNENIKDITTTTRSPSYYDSIKPQVKKKQQTLPVFSAVVCPPFVPIHHQCNSNNELSSSSSSSPPSGSTNTTAATIIKPVYIEHLASVESPMVATVDIDQPIHSSETDHTKSTSTNNDPTNIPNSDSDGNQSIKTTTTMFNQQEYHYPSSLFFHVDEDDDNIFHDVSHSSCFDQSKIIDYMFYYPIQSKNYFINDPIDNLMDYLNTHHFSKALLESHYLIPKTKTHFNVLSSIILNKEQQHQQHYSNTHDCGIPLEYNNNNNNNSTPIRRNIITSPFIKSKLDFNNTTNDYNEIITYYDDLYDPSSTSSYYHENLDIPSQIKWLFDLEDDEKQPISKKRKKNYYMKLKTISLSSLNLAEKKEQTKIHVNDIYYKLFLNLNLKKDHQNNIIKNNPFHHNNNNKESLSSSKINMTLIKQQQQQHIRSSTHHHHSLNDINPNKIQHNIIKHIISKQRYTTTESFVPIQQQTENKNDVIKTSSSYKNTPLSEVVPQKKDQEQLKHHFPTVTTTTTTTTTPATFRLRRHLRRLGYNSDNCLDPSTTTLIPIINNNIQSTTTKSLPTLQFSSPTTTTTTTTTTNQPYYHPSYDNKVPQFNPIHNEQQQYQLSSQELQQQQQQSATISLPYFALPLYVPGRALMPHSQQQQQISPTLFDDTRSIYDKQNQNKISLMYKQSLNQSNLTSIQPSCSSLNNQIHDNHHSTQTSNIDSCKKIGMMFQPYTLPKIYNDRTTTSHQKLCYYDPYTNKHFSSFNPIEYNKNLSYPIITHQNQHSKSLTSFYSLAATKYQKPISETMSIRQIYHPWIPTHTIGNNDTNHQQQQQLESTAQQSFWKNQSFETLIHQQEHHPSLSATNYWPKLKNHNNAVAKSFPAIVESYDPTVVSKLSHPTVKSNDEDLVNCQQDKENIFIKSGDDLKYSNKTNFLNYQTYSTPLDVENNLKSYESNNSEIIPLNDEQIIDDDHDKQQDEPFLIMTRDENDDNICIESPRFNNHEESPLKYRKTTTTLEKNDDANMMFTSTPTLLENQQECNNNNDNNKQLLFTDSTEKLSMLSVSCPTTTSILSEPESLHYSLIPHHCNHD